MSDKTKRRLAIAGAAVIGLALVVAIGMRFAKEPEKPDASSQEPASSSEVAPVTQDNTEKKEVVVSPQPSGIICGRTGTSRLRNPIKNREKTRPQQIKSCGLAILNPMKKGGKSMKSKRIAMLLCMALMLCLMFSTTAYAAGTGDVAGAIEGTWSTASKQIKTVVNKVVFPAIELILAVFFFAKLGTAYFDYRKHGQFEWAAPAILFACLVFTLTAPLYIWTILGL